MNRLDRLLARIAREQLGFPTLATRRSDSLDFREVAVWQVEAALREAYQAGTRAGPSPLMAAPGKPALFDAYEIHGVREFDDGDGRYCEQVPDTEAEFWSLYGHIPGQGLDCIGDFKTRQHAEEVFARITGRRYNSGDDSTRKG